MKKQEHEEPRRAYRSPRRREQARATRERVLDSAAPPLHRARLRGRRHRRDRRRRRRLARDRLRDASATSARCSASSSGARCAAATRRRCPSRRAPSRSPPSTRPARAAAALRRRHRAAPGARRPAARGAHDRSARRDAELAALLARIHAERRANLAPFVAALAADGAAARRAGRGARHGVGDREPRAPPTADRHARLDARALLRVARGEPRRPPAVRSGRSHALLVARHLEPRGPEAPPLAEVDRSGVRGQRAERLIGDAGRGESLVDRVEQR